MKKIIGHYASRERAQMAKESATRVIKRRKGHGWTKTKRRLRKFWPARAILDESSTQYLIEWDPVSSGVGCERQWEPKYHANTALIAEWEERKEANIKRKSNSEQADTSFMQLAREGHDHQATEVDPRPEQTIARPASSAERTDLVDEPQSSDNNRNMTQMRSHGKLRCRVQSDTLATISVGPSEVSNIHVSSIREGLTHMRNGNDKSPSESLPSTVSYEAEQECSPALLMGPHSGMLADPKQACTVGTAYSTHAPLAESVSKERSSRLEASTVHISESRSDHKPPKVASEAKANNHGPPRNAERVPGDRSTHGCDVKKHSARPGTSIATLLSPIPSDLTVGQENGSVLYLEKNDNQAPARAQADVTVSSESDAARSNTPPGKLASARKQLRSLLRGSGRKRVRRSRSVLSPPA